MIHDTFYGKAFELAFTPDDVRRFSDLLVWCAGFEHQCRTTCRMMAVPHVYMWAGEVGLHPSERFKMVASVTVKGWVSSENRMQTVLTYPVIKNARADDLNPSGTESRFNWKWGHLGMPWEDPHRWDFTEYAQLEKALVQALGVAQVITQEGGNR